MNNSTTTSIESLERKQQFTGTVKKVELFGAIVDIGLSQPGLVHISQLSEGRINNVSDVLSEGQEVTVWVRRVDKQTGRIELTMIEPPQRDWAELQVGQTVRGKVVRVESFGAFVDVGAQRPGLVHVSELSGNYVKSPSDVVSIGDEVEARVIGVNRKKGRIDLSVKALSATSEAEEPVEEEEEGLTAFAAAYQRALQAEEDEATGSKEESGSSRHDRERRLQEELLERTLEQHKNRPH